MLASRLRSRALRSLFVAAATASLIGCQHLLTSSTPQAATPAFQTLEMTQAPSFAPDLVPAQFETEALSFAVLSAPAPIAAPKLPLAMPTLQTSAAADLHAASEALQPFALEAEQEAASIAARPLLFESGIASTYGQGDGFEGERTGCGSIFRTHVIQVAHKTLPCGTLIRIEDTDTGKTVDAEVTDRGPYVKGRIVDLSYAAFTQLDASGTGLLNVNVYILDTSNQYVYRLR